MALIASLAACGETTEEGSEDPSPDDNGFVNNDPGPDQTMSPPTPDMMPDADPTPDMTPDDPAPDTPTPDPTPDPMPDAMPEPTPDPMPDPMPDAMPDPMPDMVNELCPPEGPFGNGIGDVAPDVTLMDCEGNPHSIRELCAHKVGWIFEFAAWCPPCRQFAAGFEDFTAQFEGEDVGIFFIIGDNSNFAAPSAQDCRSIKEQYGLTGTVLYDADRAFQRALGVPSNDINIIMTEGNVIQFKRQHANSQVRGEINRLLSE